MANFFHSVFQTFFLIGFIILFIVTIVILKPFRYHKRRQKSTIMLKMSYVLYLASFEVFTYLLLFGNKENPSNEMAYDTIFNVHFIFFITSAIVPNIGIMIRRKVRKKRIEYNLIVSLVNLLYCCYLSYLCTSGKWAMM